MTMPRAEPLVTVIIPSYNMAHLLPDAVNSVLGQDYKNFQILIVDDGSTDNTREVAAQWDDARIEYIHKANAGLSAARNTGLSHTRGDYLCFLDADDLFLKEKTSRQVRHLIEHPTAAAVTGSVIRSDETGRVLYRYRRTSESIPRSRMFVGNQTPVHALLFRTSWVMRTGTFDESLRGAEDWDFLCRMMLLGGPIHQRSEFVCDYRIFRGSMSTNTRRQTDAVETVIGKTFNHPAMPIEYAPLREKSLVETHFTGARKAWLAMDGDAFAEYLSNSLPKMSRYRKHPESAVEAFIYYARHLDSVEMSERKDFFYRHLPEDASILRPTKSSWDFIVAKDRLFTAIDAGEKPAAVNQAGMLLAKHPLAVVKRAFGRLAG